jgi:hypothetical protein
MLVSREVDRRNARQGTLGALLREAREQLCRVYHLAYTDPSLADK